MNMTVKDFKQMFYTLSFFIGEQQSEQIGLKEAKTKDPMFGIPPFKPGKGVDYHNIWYSHTFGDDNYHTFLGVWRRNRHVYNTNPKFFHIGKEGVLEMFPKEAKDTIKQEKVEGEHVSERVILTKGSLSHYWEEGKFVDFYCNRCSETIRGCVCVQCPDCGGMSAPILLDEGNEWNEWYCKACEVFFDHTTIDMRFACELYQSDENEISYVCLKKDKEHSSFTNPMDFRVAKDGSHKMEWVCPACKRTEPVGENVMEYYHKYEQDKKDREEYAKVHKQMEDDAKRIEGLTE